jgi:hypothetical protein
MRPQDGLHGDDRQHHEDEQYVVEPLVAKELPTEDGHVRPGGRDARGGRPEHESGLVEHLLEQDPESVGGQGQEDPREADGRDGDDGAHRHGHQPGQEQRRQPWDVPVDGEVSERRGSDGGEGQVTQRDLTRGLDQ